MIVGSITDVYGYDYVPDDCILSLGSPKKVMKQDDKPIPIVKTEK